LTGIIPDRAANGDCVGRHTEPLRSGVGLLDNANVDD